MIRPLRLLAGLALALGLAAGAQARLPAGTWPQARSDIAPDPAIRFGALPNGMRFAILRNTTPAGAASLRLRIAAGSLMEHEDERGLAHFLEHMAFDGSKRVPSGEMVKILERHGLSFGADTNASTGFDATSYKLDLPRADAVSIDDALMLLREAASNLTLAQSAIDKERGVILAEKRLRDTPSYRVFADRLDFLMAGQRPPLREPIGKTEVIENASRAQLLDLYRRYYRPERATLIVVGDVDPAEMEAKIRAAFGDWRGNGADGGDPDLGAVRPRGLDIRLGVEPGAPTSLQLAFVAAPENGDSLAKRRQDLVDALALAVLNRRLEAKARTADAPYIAAGAMHGDMLHAAEISSLTVTARGDDWRSALGAAEAAEQTAARFGVQPEELAREITETRAALQEAADSAATRSNPSIADEIEGAVAQDAVETSPAQDLAFFERQAPTITAEEASQALRRMFTGAGPLVFVSSPEPIAGGGAVVKAAFEAAAARPVAAPAAPIEVAWPYTSFGQPSKVVERREVADLGVTFVRFANGMRLTIKPTKFARDEAEVKVRAAGGLAALPRGEANLAWAGEAFTDGGFGKLSADDAERALAAKVYGARFDLEDDALALSGVTTRQDLETQLQVLAAYVSDPGWRPAAFTRMRDFVAGVADEYDHTDFGVLGRELPELLHGGDARWAFPDHSEIADASLPALERQLAPLRQAPLEVVIVGDVDVDGAIAAVERTFGALPPRSGAAPAPKAAPAFPAASKQAVVLTHEGLPDQAIAVEAWPAQGFFVHPQQARDLAILGEVLELRLIDKLRKSESLTYAPQVSYDSSLVWPHWGYISATVEAPPAALVKVMDDISEITTDLAAHGVSADELERAKKPKIDAVARAEESNGYWLEALSGAQTDPRRLAMIRTEVSGLQRVTGADVRAAARRYLRPDAAWRLKIEPAAAVAAATTPPSPA
ncbi:MAG TPA: insulinase family protein [Caulobacteraceae bacterium]|nr:insulinase family protein [Caulobacteraceae bacterium]